MQFLVLGFDGDDAGALDRRMAVREKHLADAKGMQESGKLLYAAAMLNEAEQMNGSAMVCEFASRADLDRWLETEVYATSGVWQRIQVIPCRVPAHFAR